MRVMPKDSRGVELEVDQKVAYNRSGDVIEGTIVGISASAARIIPDEPWSRGYYAGKISRMRNFRSILVLERA